MAHQALDNNEILNVRWATVDPNPLSAKREAARIEEQAAEAVRRALGDRAVREIEGRETREERDQRKIESGYGLEGYEAPEAIWYNQQRDRELEGQRLGERGLLGAPSGQDDADIQYAGEAEPAVSSNQSTDPAGAADNDQNGILSGSTLAALKGLTAAGRTPTPTQPQPAKSVAPPPSGLLVGYGSDDDSD